MDEKKLDKDIIVPEKKQIEEMQKDIAVRMAMAKGVIGSMNNGVEGWLTEYLIEKDWVKLPEGAVIISKAQNENWLAWLEQNIKKARKETAEKFAERLKEKLHKEALHSPLLTKEYVQRIIREIAKEFTGGYNGKEKES